jgi:hypothetical protein
MIRAYRQVLANRNVGIALAVAALSVVAEGHAWACTTGHANLAPAVLMPPDSGSSSIRSYLQPTPVALTPPLSCLQCPDAPLSPDKAPCRGPSCSGQQLPEGLAAPKTTDGRDSSWSLVVTLTFLPEDLRANRLFAIAMGAPIRRTDSIFHPPRYR